MTGGQAGILTAYGCPYHYYFVIDGRGVIRWRGLYDDTAVRAVVDTALAELALAGVDDLPGAGARLGEAYPNPFNPRVRIPYEVGGTAGDARVVLEILDLRGRVVRTLVQATQSAGRRHEAVWDGTDAAGRHLASGTYLARLTVDGVRQARSVTLLR